MPKNKLQVLKKNLRYLETVHESILKAESPRDLSEIKEELAEQGYISNTASKKKKKTQKSMPMKFNIKRWL